MAASRNSTTVIYVIDVAEGDKIPRKGGPAIRNSDLLLINKTDLAPYVGADLEVMERDSRKMRGERPFLFADLKSEKGKEALLGWIRREALFVLQQDSDSGANADADAEAEAEAEADAKATR